MSDLIVDCQGVSKSYPAGDGGTQNVLQEVTFSVAAGEAVSILGTSGIGKTTLLHLLGGLDSYDKGMIAIAGRDWTTMNKKTAANWRNQHLGFVFQFHLLLPEFSAAENAAMPLLLRKTPRQEALKKAMEMLERLDLSQHADKPPSKMSGGERQRTAIARALIGNPSCVLADEPTGNLDEKNARIVFDMLFENCRRQQAALILVSHNTHLASLTDRQMKLHDGVLQKQ